MVKNNLGTPWGKLLAVVSAFVILLTTFVPASNHRAIAADLSQFNAGNIISDSIFYDGTSMNASGVQAFLNSKVPTCTINNGQASHAAGAPYGSTTISDVCLKNYTQATPSMAAQPGICAAYQGSSSESAASIIAKVGAACNISPKVLLVLLEKEQSLITDSWPTVRQINQATGFACYDNGQPCVQDYAGFFYQVWSAARQFQRYGTSPFTWYPVGQTSNILYQANMPECGTKSVFIQNRATAALYYYTPYTPNNAALAAGYGLGDACSAYGNRNFYQLYVDWFGSTQGLDVIAPLRTVYDSIGASSSVIGSAVANQRCGFRDSGCSQVFQNGFLIDSQSTGGHYVLPSVWNLWGTFGGENGVLGYPTGNPSVAGSTYTQSFEGGIITVTNGTPSVLDSWSTTAVRNTWLGYPTRAKWCTFRDSGCSQVFQNGYIVSSATSGVRVVKPEVWTLWGAYGGENGSLGYPNGDPSASGSNYTQTFEGGVAVVTNGVATLLTRSSDPWRWIEATNTWLGASTRVKLCVYRDSGCSQVFQNGYIVSSATSGVRVVKPEVWTLWGAYGGENGSLGYPNGDPSASGSNYTQTFEGGTVTVTNGVATLTASTNPWLNKVASNTWLGASTRVKLCVYRDSGCSQVFQNGYIVSSATSGVRVVKPEVWTLWGAYGGENGSLGYPNGDPSASGSNYTQTFEGGTVTVTNGVATLTASTNPWLNKVASNTWLGASTRVKLCVYRDSGCSQVFQNGYIVSSATSGVRVVKPEVWTLWGAYGGENGSLGYPNGDPSASGSNYTQTFEGGTVTVTNGVATLTASTNPWLNKVASNTWLGASTRVKLCVYRDSGCSQVFQNGYIVSSATSGVRVVKPEVWTLWGAYGGENGSLGYPNGDPSASGSNYTQTFEGGTVTVTNGVATLTASTNPWLNKVASNTWLGASTRVKLCVYRDSGCSQVFQNGYIVSSATSGVRVVKPEVWTLWGAYGGENGSLGYPNGDPSASGSNYTQTFEGGTVTVTNGVARRNLQ